MAHQIEVNGEQAAFVSVRENAWHKLGTVVESELTAAEALEAAYLANWNVRKEEIYLANGTKVPDRFATVRNNPFTQDQVDVLGVVGTKYEPIQNEDHAELLDALVGESGSHFQTAGSLYGGKQTFITMKLPNTMKIAGIDEIETYIAALNSHDGSKAFQFIVTPIRIVCANTQAAALRNAHSRFSVRHTKSGSSGIIAQARECLGLTYKYMYEFEVKAQEMIQKSMTDDQFESIISQLYPQAEEASDIVQLRTEIHHKNLFELWNASPTMTDIKGTAWAGYQAVTEYLDHYIDIQGKDASKLAEYRALAAVSGKSDAFKSKAFDLFAGAR